VPLDFTSVPTKRHINLSKGLSRQTDDRVQTDYTTEKCVGIGKNKTTGSLILQEGINPIIIIIIITKL